MRHYLMPLLLCFFFTLLATAQSKEGDAGKQQEGKEQVKAKRKPKVLFGLASYYADKFNGRKTASGEIYNHDKPTAACNTVPIGTWLRITNLKNQRSVVVRVNDRLHPRMKRVVDLNKTSALKLGYIRSGLTQVKVEILGAIKPKEGV
jgi:rare lipoprotein A